ncbi:PucR family transcriptional regulator [Nocardia sp. JW2]|uniref:PucR family transcriptional regulator n=1 Tax=Nocardia sp. JW2 TaxID=3450738 RepID=UPI003F442F9D
MSAVIRGYQVGNQLSAELWADAVVAHAPERSDAVELVKVGISYLLGAVEIITSALAVEYVEEAERLARERSLERVEAVRRVLNDQSIEIDSASALLGYRLDGRHVAVVLREGTERSDTGAALDVARRKLLRAFGLGTCLTVRVDMRTVWVWLAAPACSRTPIATLTSSVSAAVGRPAFGLEGFRRSHREAIDAMRVAELADPVSATVTYFGDVDIAALCSMDTARCREFIHSELGALAATGKAAALQRATLAAFFAANSNYRATGVDLGIHHNTVRYRLEQVERLLGRDLGERRLALELALHLYDVLGLSTC